MRLVKFENYRLVISEEALYVKSFRMLWDRDTSNDKSKAISEFGYMYFFYDPRSDYNYITDLVERQRAIIEQEGFSSNWKPDKLLLAAIQDYKTLVITTSSLLLEDTKKAVTEVRRFLRDLNMDAVDDKGKPKYTINTITAAVNQMSKLSKDIAEAERSIVAEIAENNRMRGQKQKKVMENGLSIQR